MQTTSNQHNDLVIDWELSLKLAGGKHELARDMLNWLINSLPDELAKIKSAASDHDHDALMKYLHKLHGATCYCGVPRLKKAISTFESALKQNNITIFDTFLTNLEDEVSQLIDHVAQLGEK